MSRIAILSHTELLVPGLCRTEVVPGLGRTEVVPDLSHTAQKLGLVHIEWMLSHIESKLIHTV